MINLNTDIEKLFNLPLKIIVALCISSGLILFLPSNIIEKLYMLSFRHNFGFILGLVFVISLSIILCTIIVFIVKIITNKAKDKKLVNAKNKFMESLDKNEKRLLKQMYNESDKTLNLSYNSGTVAKLTKYGVIAPTSPHSYIDLLYPQMPYFLQPWVCKYIEEHKDFFK